MQHAADTLNRLAPFHAKRVPAANARPPDAGVCVEYRMVGNVITASVTYGT